VVVVVGFTVAVGVSVVPGASAVGASAVSVQTPLPEAMPRHDPHATSMIVASATDPNRISSALPPPPLSYDTFQSSARGDNLTGRHVRFGTRYRAVSPASPSTLMKEVFGHGY